MQTKPLAEHVDRTLALQSAPGYNEAVTLFHNLYYGGESATHAFEMALLTFFEKGK